MKNAVQKFSRGLIASRTPSVAELIQLVSHNKLYVPVTVPSEIWHIEPKYRHLKDQL